jgi:hypothetical protein
MKRDTIIASVINPEFALEAQIVTPIDTERTLEGAEPVLSVLVS